MKKKSLEERKKEFSYIMEKYPSKIPIILDKNPNFPNLKNPIKNKFLLGKDFTVKQFFNIISKTYLQIDMVKDDLNLEIKLYSTSNNIEIPTNIEESIINIYNKYKDEDGFLYLQYSYLYIKNKNVGEKEGNKVIKQFPNKIPIILKKDLNYSDIKDISKSKFIIDKSYTVEQLISSLNKNYLNENIENIYLTTDSKEKLFKYEILSDVYNKYKDKNDGILYLLYYYNTNFSIEEFKLKSSKERKKEYEFLIEKNPNMIPIIIEKDSNYPDNKSISKNNILVKKTMEVYELLQLINLNYLNLSPSINDKNLNLVLTISPYHVNLSNTDKISTIYEEYRNEDGFLYLNYSYEYIQNNCLNYFEPKNKYNNLQKTSIKSISEILPNNRIPVYIEKYPLSYLYDLPKKRYYILSSSKIFDLKNFIMKNFKKNKIDNINFNIIIANYNIDITNEDKTLIKDLYDKYKNYDSYLYLFYLEPSLLKEIMSKKKFNFKERYTLEERKKIYKDLKNKHQNKILIRIENEYNNNKKEKIDEILFFEPNNVIDSLKMKIWKKNGKPFLRIILKDENKTKIEFESSQKIIDLYNKYKDKEDEFLYLFYKMEKTDFNIMDNELKHMSKGQKIFLLFKRIPFIIRPSSIYANSKIKKEVYLEYKSQTFKDIKTDKKYKYYIEYPNKILDLNEKILDFYLRNKNKNNDFLYLTIEKE